MPKSQNSTFYALGYIPLPYHPVFLLANKMTSIISSAGNRQLHSSSVCISQLCGSERVDSQKMPYLDANWMHAQIASPTHCFQHCHPRWKTMFQDVSLDLEDRFPSPQSLWRKPAEPCSCMGLLGIYPKVMTHLWGQVVMEVLVFSSGGSLTILLVLGMWYFVF